MRRAQDVRKQLLGIMDRYKHEILSCGKVGCLSLPARDPVLTSRRITTESVAP